MSFSNFKIGTTNDLPKNHKIRRMLDYVENHPANMSDKYTYIIWDKTNMPDINKTSIKIGRSKSPIIRFANIKSISNNANLELYLMLKNKCGVNSELILHKYFSSYRSIGEWFYINPFTAIEMITNNGLLEYLFQWMIELGANPKELHE